MVNNKLNIVYWFSWSADELRGQAFDYHSGQCVSPQRKSSLTDVEGACSKWVES